MGTNFYWHEKPPCESCGQDCGEEKHIGKSSGGWCFSLHAYPEDNINDLADWMPILKKSGSYIKNEYGDPVTVDELLDTITNRSWERSSEYAFDYAGNYAEPGPNGLVRHRVCNTNRCVKQGEGTWDCITGDFS